VLDSVWLYRFPLDGPHLGTKPPLSASVPCIPTQIPFCGGPFFFSGWSVLTQFHFPLFLPMDARTPLKEPIDPFEPSPFWFIFPLNLSPIYPPVFSFSVPPPNLLTPLQLPTHDSVSPSDFQRAGLGRKFSLLAFLPLFKGLVSGFVELSLPD